jgi:hypothetical protein
MQIGDITVATDNNGHESVCIITEVHPDGTVDVSEVRTTTRALRRSSRERSHGSVFDPNLREEALAMPAPVMESPVVPAEHHGHLAAHNQRKHK